MPKYFPLALMAAQLATGQVLDLATNEDGREIYFSTYYRLANSPRNPAAFNRIVRFRDGIWTTIAESDAFQIVSLPRVTGDGKILYWVQSSGCFGGSCFINIPRPNMAFSGMDPAVLKIPAHSLLFSRNGRFALSPGYNLDPSGPRPAVQQLDNGRVWNQPDSNLPNFTSDIADNGTVIGWKSNTSGAMETIVRWRPDSPPLSCSPRLMSSPSASPPPAKKPSWIPTIPAYINSSFSTWKPVNRRFFFKPSQVKSRL